MSRSYDHTTPANRLTPQWLSSDTGEAFSELVFLWYSPVWMGAVVLVVLLKLYNLFSATGYVLFGASIAVPCFVLPYMLQKRDDRRPFYTQHWSVHTIITLPVIQSDDLLKVQGQHMDRSSGIYWQLLLHCLPVHRSFTSHHAPLSTTSTTCSGRGTRW